MSCCHCKLILKHQDMLCKREAQPAATSTDQQTGVRLQLAVMASFALSSPASSAIASAAAAAAFLCWPFVLTYTSVQHHNYQGPALRALCAGMLCGSAGCCCGHLGAPGRC